MTDKEDLINILKSNTDPRRVEDLQRTWPELAHELTNLTNLQPEPPVIQPENIKLRKPVAKATGISRGWSTDHDGIDYKSKKGDNIYAAADGIVIHSSPAQGYGQWIIIQHRQNGELFETLYGHMYQRNVKADDTVKEGQIIAYVGSEGQSTGPHLHFGLYLPAWSIYKGVDPAPFIA